MSWVLIVIRVLASLPQIIALVKEVIAIIQKIRDGKEQKAELRQLNFNLKTARKNRQFRPLRDQLERLRQRYEREE